MVVTCQRIKNEATFPHMRKILDVTQIVNVVVSVCCAQHHMQKVTHFSRE